MAPRRNSLIIPKRYNKFGTVKILTVSRKQWYKNFENPSKFIFIVHPLILAHYNNYGRSRSSFLDCFNFKFNQTSLCNKRLYLDGCYSSKFLRSSARRFLLEMLVRGTRYEVRSSARRTSPLTMVKLVVVSRRDPHCTLTFHYAADLQFT